MSDTGWLFLMVVLLYGLQVTQWGLGKTHGDMIRNLHDRLRRLESWDEYDV